MIGAASDLLPWIRLTRSGASARRLNLLLAEFGTPAAILGATATELARRGRFPVAAAERLLAAALADCTADLDRLAALDIRLVLRGGPEYPPLLEQIYDPPPVLYVRGEPLPIDRPAVAVVGTRRASTYGRDVAERFARELAEAGVVVVSGMARGIDAAAHRGALAAEGTTLAVLGNGVDVIYPADHRDLAARIVRHGALLSEFPLATPPDAYNFPRRNRIISGIAHGVLIVEAGARSGALLTADCAVEQNRDVFAIPGNITHPGSAGPHELIKQGARLVDRAEEILVEIAGVRPHAAAAPPPPPPPLEPSEQQVLALLESEPKPLDDLVLESGLAPAELNGVLLMLEVKGIVRRHPGNAFARAR